MGRYATTEEKRLRVDKVISQVLKNNYFLKNKSLETFTIYFATFRSSNPSVSIKF